MAQWVMQKNELITPGSYRLKITSVRDYVNKSKGYVSKILNFTFTDPGLVSKECPPMFLNVTQSNGQVVFKKGTKIYRAIAAIIGKDSLEGEMINDEMFIGREVDANISLKPNDKGEMQNRVEELYKLGSVPLTPVVQQPTQQVYQQPVQQPVQQQPVQQSQQSVQQQGYQQQNYQKPNSNNQAVEF